MGFVFAGVREKVKVMAKKDEVTPTPMWKCYLAFILAMVVTFCLLNPFAVLDFKTFWAEGMSEARVHKMGDIIDRFNHAFNRTKTI